MPADPENAKLPVAAICANCDSKQQMNTDGSCITCGSDKMFNPVSISIFEKAKEDMQEAEAERLKRPLVIYHANCRDGFAAAWVCHNFFGAGKADFHAAQYGEKLPDVTGRNVYFVDYCPNREPVKHNITELCAAAKHVTILDHHKTAQEALTFQPNELRPQNLTIVFDMERSGAGIAWDYFQKWYSTGELKEAGLPEKGERPWFINYIEDRDLWRWALPSSRQINYYLSLVPFDLKAWDLLLNSSAEAAMMYGDVLEQKVRQYCQEVSKNTRTCSIDLDSREFLANVPVVNAPQCDISELLEFQMERLNVDFTVGFWQRNDGLFQYSLRSRGDFDVSEIAKKFGGGGHKHAAGFQVAKMVHR
jgi:oligoribonuclease NrnB/cAMP/cGMP phosphodiesterase (DHH superfamily)